MESQELAVSSATGAASAASPSLLNCSTCDEDIEFGVFFCPYCGAAQLHSMLLPGNKMALSTTANYDPLNPSYKPWRDTSHIGHRRPALPPKITSLPQGPWRPAMKNLIHGKGSASASISKIKKKGQLLRQSRVHENSADSASAAVFNEVKGEGHAEVTGRVVYFKNFAWKRRGGKPSVLDEKKVSEKEAKPAREFDDTTYKKLEQMQVHPIAVYEAKWLSVPGYTVHISFIERFHEDRENYKSQYFLRVGVTYDDPDCLGEVKEGDANAEPKGDLIALEVLQNDFARLLTPPGQYWVDLNLVRPDEYYMHSYLEASLEYVAKRVHATASFDSINEIDQVSLVECVPELDNRREIPIKLDEEGRKLPPEDPPSVVIITEQDLKLFRRRHKRALHRKKAENFAAIMRGLPGSAGNNRSPPRGRGGNRPGSSSSLNSRAASRQSLRPVSSRKSHAVGVSLGQANKEMALSLEMTIAQRAVRLHIGKIWENQYCLAIVRMTVKYPDADVLLSAPLEKRNGPEDALHHQIKAEEVILHVIPLYNKEYCAPKIIHFDTASLTPLLGSEYGNIDQVIAQGDEQLKEMFKRLTTLLHLQRHETECGYRGTVVHFQLCVSGVASIPYLRQADDHDSDSDTEEMATVGCKQLFEELVQETLVFLCTTTLHDLREIAEVERLNLLMLKSAGAMTIQAVWRRALVVKGKVLDKKRVERVRLLERARQAAILIQCLIRSMLAKAVVRRHMIARERRRLEEQTRLEAERWANKVAPATVHAAADDDDELGQDEEEGEKSEFSSSPPRKQSPVGEATIKRVLPDYIHCACHGARALRFDIELNEKPYQIFGVFSCGHVCEHAPAEEITPVKMMFQDMNCLGLVMSQGTGLWQLQVTVVDEHEPALIKLSVDSPALEAIAHNLHAELEAVTMDHEWQILGSDEGEDSNGANNSNSRYVLHNMLFDSEHKHELFRRCCAGLRVSYDSDGILQASFIEEYVHEMYEHFFDDGDLVVGI